MSGSKQTEQWMPLLVERYKRDTEDLTTEQHGAYLLLLMYGWQHEGMLPDNDARLAAIARLTPTRWRSHRAIIRAFFSADGAGNLVQKRLLLEVERAQHLSIVRADAARTRPKPDSKTGAIAAANAPPIAFANAPAIAPANATANAGAIAMQLGDNRGSPNPSSTASEPPTPDTGESSRFPPRATPAGEACRAMRAAGLADVSPSNVKLLAVLEQGATTDELSAAAAKAVSAGKGFGYALAIVKGDREDAARMALAPKPATVARFALPPGHVNVLPDDLPSLDIEEDARHVDDAQARG